MNLALTEAGYPIININPDKKSRTQYMQALLDCKTQNTMVPFENLVGEYAEKALTDRIKILQLNEQNKKEVAEETDLPPDFGKK